MSLSFTEGTASDGKRQWAVFGIVLLGATLLNWAVASASPVDLLFSGYAEERFDDNVLYSTEPAEDFVTIVGPRLLGKYLTERTDLSLSATATCYGYRQNHDLNTVDQSYDGVWRQQWSERFTASLEAVYLDDQRRDRVLEESGLLTAETRRRRVDATLGGQYTLTERNFLTASYAFLDESYDEPRIDDLMGHILQAGIHRRVGTHPERTTAFLQASYYVYEYTNSYSQAWIPGLEPISVESERDIQTWAASLGVEHRWTETLTLNANAGARYSRYKIELRQGNRYVQYVEKDEFDPWGFVGALALNYEGLHTQGSVGLSHDLAPASGRNRLTERTTLRMDCSWRPIQEWLLGANASAFLNRSEESGAASDIDELSTVMAATVRYEFNRQWSLGLRYTFNWIDDRENDIDRNRNIVGLLLGWNLPVWE
jgi:outer membrane receptor protein involved in Fe transport